MRGKQTAKDWLSFKFVELDHKTTGVYVRDVHGILWKGLIWKVHIKKSTQKKTRGHKK